ncbi:MAG: sigma-54-dependent Fis family transcriptional regulator, partial [Deltaproteobacteria bacterium]|nr:sigma-54-dependent Fis family transcriptional regulator [Deltaproteobacteria bacterium]
AHRGTLFLDEVAELTPSFQVKLLRVLQEKRFEQVGGERSVNVDVRVISATNRDLRQMVRDGAFRDDLYYRLCVVPIQLPPLRSRHEDLPLLVEKILADVRRDTGKPIARVSDDALDLMLTYRWPGNVRELINALQAAAVRCTGDEIEPRHLPPEIRSPQVDLDQPAAGTAPAVSDSRLRRPRSKLDRLKVERALAAAGGNKVKAAQLLSVGRATLYRYLDSLDENS